MVSRYHLFSHLVIGLIYSTLRELTKPSFFSHLLLPLSTFTTHTKEI